MGRAVVEEGSRTGWKVTTFNRGTHPAPEGVTALRGDRLADLSALERGEWDLVVDTWSHAPSAVRASARLLAGRAGHYSYVSTRSVYAFPTPADAAEDAPLVEGDPGGGESGYDVMKRGSELAVEESFGDRAAFVRAGLILGPHENIGRLPWWLTRIARGGPVLAPGPADGGIQFVDARDLAAWTLANPSFSGPCDLVSPVGHASMRDLLEACVAATGSDADLRWTDPETILAAGVEPWTELPCWIPPGPGHDGMHGSDVSLALSTGLRCRPVTETVADTWTWLRSIGGRAPQRPDRPPVGLTAETERRVLAL
ncbi:SDR family oxidoreductase [Actinocorallia longicatena]|uniref:SDR family oxidoreductase n=1 Tax=Actinocorallia longicatena TaxID=111803 RepID=A0ABP6PYS1_9ACTN